MGHSNQQLTAALSVPVVRSRRRAATEDALAGAVLEAVGMGDAFLTAEQKLRRGRRAPTGRAHSRRTHGAK